MRGFEDVVVTALWILGNVLQDWIRRYWRAAAHDFYYSGPKTPHVLTRFALIVRAPGVCNHLFIAGYQNMQPPPHVSRNEVACYRTVCRDDHSQLPIISVLELNPKAEK